MPDEIIKLSLNKEEKNSRETNFKNPTLLKIDL